MRMRVSGLTRQETMLGITGEAGWWAARPVTGATDASRPRTPLAIGQPFDLR